LLDQYDYDYDLDQYDYDYDLDQYDYDYDLDLHQDFHQVKVSKRTKTYFE